jgi:hypothetical protein
LIGCAVVDVRHCLRSLRARYSLDLEMNARSARCTPRSHDVARYSVRACDVTPHVETNIHVVFEKSELLPVSVVGRATSVHHAAAIVSSSASTSPSSPRDERAAEPRERSEPAEGGGGAVRRRRSCGSLRTPFLGG